MLRYLSMAVTLLALLAIPFDSPATVGRTRTCLFPRNAIFPNTTLCQRLFDTDGQDVIRCPGSSACSDTSNCAFYFTAYFPFDIDFTGTNDQSLKAGSYLLFKSPDGAVGGYGQWDIAAYVTLDETDYPHNFMIGHAMTPSWTYFNEQLINKPAEDVYGASHAKLSVETANNGNCGSPGLDCRGHTLNIRISRRVPVGETSADLDFIQYCFEGDDS